MIHLSTIMPNSLTLKRLILAALAIRYQIQEMLRIEKIFESAGIQEDMAAAQHGERITFGIEHGNYDAR